MVAIDCPETSATNYQSTLRKITEERRSHIKSYENYIYQFHCTGMCLCITWRLPTEPKGSAEHSLNTTRLGLYNGEGKYVTDNAAACTETSEQPLIFF
jgi:hypothetical protein